MAMAPACVLSFRFYNMEILKPQRFLGFGAEYKAETGFPMCRENRRRLQCEL